MLEEEEIYTACINHMPFIVEARAQGSYGREETSNEKKTLFSKTAKIII